MSKTVVVNLCLLCVAIVWGVGFIPQKKGMEFLSPSAFNAMRFAIGALTLVPMNPLTRNKSIPFQLMKRQEFKRIKKGLSRSNPSQVKSEKRKPNTHAMAAFV